jgi:hypothetical protein
VPQGVDAYMYGLTPTDCASPSIQPARQQGEASRLHGKLQSAELRAVGLGETVKVLEASLKVKDDTITRLEGLVTVCFLNVLSIALCAFITLLSCTISGMNRDGNKSMLMYVCLVNGSHVLEPHPTMLHQ